MPQVGDATARLDNIGVTGHGAQLKFFTSVERPKVLRVITERATGSVLPAPPITARDLLASGAVSD
jgi:hypothetical protein